MSDYLKFDGATLANKIYRSYRKELKPAFKKMLDLGYTDVALVHTTGSFVSLDSKDWAVHRGNFIFTSPEKNSFGLISQTDDFDALASAILRYSSDVTLHPSYISSHRPKEIGTFKLQDLRGVLANPSKFSDSKDLEIHQIKKCSEAADLAIVLQADDFNVLPSSPEAVSVKRMVHPVQTRIARAFHSGYELLHLGGSRETEHVATR